MEERKEASYYTLKIVMQMMIAFDFQILSPYKIELKLYLKLAEISQCRECNLGGLGLLCMVQMGDRYGAVRRRWHSACCACCSAALSALPRDCTLSLLEIADKEKAKLPLKCWHCHYH